MFVTVYVFVVRVEHENLKQKTGQQFKIIVPTDRWWNDKIKVKHTETHYIEDDGLNMSREKPVEQQKNEIETQRMQEEWNST
jgi:hypothetical protein